MTPEEKIAIVFVLFMLSWCGSILWMVYLMEKDLKPKRLEDND